MPRVWPLGAAAENKGELCIGVGNVILFSSQCLLNFPLSTPQRDLESREEIERNKMYEVAEGRCFPFVMDAWNSAWFVLCNSADGFLYPNRAVAMLLLCIPGSEQGFLPLCPPLSPVLVTQLSSTLVAVWGDREGC